MQNVFKFTATVLTALLVAGTAASAKDLILSGNDCYVGVDVMKCTESIYLPGCSWGIVSSGYWKPMSLESEKSLSYLDAKIGLSVNVLVEGDRIFANLTAPNANISETRDFVIAQSGIPNVTFATSYKPADENAEGRHYQVSCHPGLTDEVDRYQKENEAEMNRLGPQGEWQDANAPSLQTLAIGTVLELRRPMTIGPVNQPNVLFVEGLGLATQAQFDAIDHQWRFAFARISNANNGFQEITKYPEGMKIRVTAIEKQAYDSGGHNYTLRFETLTAGIQDPITWMQVDGRRSGRFDTKIAQFAELIGSYFKIANP